MTPTTQVKTIIAFSFLTTMVAACKSENHIDRYKVNLDTIKTLPDNFYAYRRGRIYVEDVKVENYRIWFNLDNDGNVQNIYRIEDFKKVNSNLDITIKTYAIDTSLVITYTQRFIDLSRLYKFGHINIDKKNKVSFSYKDGLAEQYVKALNDSLNSIYASKKDFVLLPNGWFEHVEQ